MRQKSDHYQYIARYVDDMAIVSRDPKSITNELEVKYHLKLRGSGPISYHLGCDFFRDDKGVMCMSPKRYIERAIDTNSRIFGEHPKARYSSPLEGGDHPELDITDLLDEEGIKHYQSLIGILQWLVTLGRLDIATVVMKNVIFQSSSDSWSS